MKKNFKFYLLVFIILIPFLHFGQNQTYKFSYNSYDNIIINSDTIHYYFTRIDTIVNHFSKGIPNELTYSTWDSTYIWADIIFLDLPDKYGKYNIELGIKIQELIGKEKINLLNAFRDAGSSTLFRFSSKFAFDEITRRNGYIGTFRQNKSFLITN